MSDVKYLVENLQTIDVLEEAIKRVSLLGDQDPAAFKARVLEAVKGATTEDQINKALGQAYKRWDDESSSKSAMNKQVMAAIKIYRDLFHEKSIGAATCVIDGVFEDMIDHGKDEGERIYDIDEEEADKQEVAKRTQAVRAREHDQRVKMVTNLGIPREYLDEYEKLYPAQGYMFDTNIMNQIKSAIERSNDPKDQLFFLNSKLTKDGEKREKHYIEHGMSYSDTYSVNDYVRAAAKVMTNVQETKKEKAKTDAANAEVAANMAMTTWGNDGNATKPVSSIYIAMRELFGDRRKDGSVVLDLDANNMLMPYLNPAPYSFETGRHILDANNEGLINLRKKIHNVIPDDVKLDFITNPSGRSTVYAKLYNDYEAAKASNSKEPNPGWEILEAITILRRTEEIDALRAQGKNEIPSFPRGNKEYAAYQQRALDYARVAAGFPSQLKADEKAAETAKATTEQTTAPTPELANVAEIKKRTTFHDVSEKERKDTLAMQLFLIGQGYDLGKYGPDGNGADGLFGPKTAAALNEYQKANGIEGDGTVCTSATLKKMQEKPGANVAQNNVGPLAPVSPATATLGFNPYNPFDMMQTLARMKAEAEQQALAQKKADAEKKAAPKGQSIFAQAPAQNANAPFGLPAGIFGIQPAATAPVETAKLPVQNVVNPFSFNSQPISMVGPVKKDSKTL